MLIEFTCSNHCSILDPVTLSFVAGADKTRIEQTYLYNKIHILPSAIIYGANGSGKTNTIDAIRYMQWLVLNNMSFRPKFTNLQRQHKLAEKDNSSLYKINFVKNGASFCYGFEIADFGIKTEFLYTYPNGRRKKVFERENEDVSLGSAYKREAFSAAFGALRKNRLFLSCASDLCNIPECLETYRFICEDLVFCWNGRQRSIFTDSVDEQGEPRSENWEEYSLRVLQENEVVHQQVLSLMRYFGYPFKDIQVELKSLSSSDIPPIFNADFMSRMQSGKIQARRGKIDWGDFTTDLSTEESSGIRKLCWFLVPFLTVMKEGKVLICDELDCQLHETIVRELLEMINQQNTGEQCPQFLLTAHSSSLLSSDFFRRDQIWFTEIRNENRTTDLYSLAEIKDVRADGNFRTGYLSGRYGAIPALNHNFHFPTEGAE